MEDIVHPDFDARRLLQQLNILDQSKTSDDAERVQIKEALGAALLRLETPWETALRIVFTQPALAAALKVCFDIGLFQKWVEEYGGRSATGEQLAELVRVDASLLVRFLRHLNATHIIRQSSLGVYDLTNFSRALATRDIASTIPFLYNTTLPGFANLPAFLQSVQHVNPTDASRTNWHHMRGLSRFDELKQHPADIATYQAVMTAYAASKTPWTELYPTKQLFEARRPDVPLIVDVGGGVGHDIERLRKCMSHTAPGALVLQDLGPVIGRAAAHESVRAMVHDFFEEQPVKGATAYYLHTVLHDWPDARAVAILSNIAAAAEPNYSRVLIHETVVTDTPSVLATTSDLQMMMVLSSFERTESAWHDIVTASGLHVLKIWRASGSAESIIEAIKRKEP